MGQILISSSPGSAGGYEARQVSASQMGAIRRFVDSVTLPDAPAGRSRLDTAGDSDIRPPHLGANLDVYA